LPTGVRQAVSGHRLHRFAQILAAPERETLYDEMIAHWRRQDGVVIGSQEPATVLTDRSQRARLTDLTDHMMFLDLISYLPDDILTKVDRASMAVSLEARVPLLDHRVVEFAWQLPTTMKLRNNQGKWPLRQILHRYVPRTLIERPKMGFGVPIDVWLRGSLREWAEELLDERRLRHEGMFEPTLIRQRWSEHLSGTRNWQYLLWDVLQFQAWLAHWGSGTRQDAPTIAH
jgi:asparagine synthase (glutamine-hydrolysing)